IERIEHGVRNECRVVQRSQLGQPNSIGESALDIDRDSEGEPGLSYAPHASQRKEPRAGEQALDLGQLLAPPDEAGDPRRYVMQAALRSGSAHISGLLVGHHTAFRRML